MSSREKYRNIRYEYYHCGRSLMLGGSFFAGGILLGYAVETTLKAGLIEILNEEEKRNNKILKSHDIAKVLEECRKRNLFENIEVSADFIDHINNNFQRYPSQQKEIFNKATEKDIVLCNSVDFLYYYDDLLIQLDNYLLMTTSDSDISMAFFAFRTLETSYAREFLRENAFALKLFNEFSEIVIKESQSLRSDLKQTITENIKKGSIFYWNTNKTEEAFPAEMIKVLENYKCSNFKFQKWGDKSYVTV